MTTGQIIILSIMGLGVLIGYIKTMLSKTDAQKFGWGFFQIFFTSLFILIAVLMTSEREDALKKLKEKCPEYEKIENVYILKYEK
jgi:hypothetical protein